MWDVGYVIQLSERVARLEIAVNELKTAINQIGEQTTWTVQTLAAILAGLDRMQADFARVGPIGMLKEMMKGARDGR